ncbi:MAG TPA: flagellar assembly peptidoglycan hydrolase FlgJ [Chromatiales bacterium]|nr:flagellar assembly peptidoglycan hydrolase FlgJ [Chromatiales bacterium]
MNTDVARVYTDFEGITRLKSQARDDAGGTLDEVARQFESLLLGQMLKSMRQASLGEGLLDNDQTLFYRDMYDKQLAIHMAESGGIGLAEAIKRQLGGAVPSVNDPGAVEKTDASAKEPGFSMPTKANDAIRHEPEFKSPEDFIRHLRPLAEKAAAELGVKAGGLLAQAALETGWGKGVIRHADGTSSHNLFNIKADRRWQGARVLHTTLEVEHGIPVRQQAAFRAYDSFDESFRDYVDFLKSNPRYREALQAASDPARYFRHLQEAGYATDPRYAEKVLDVAGKIALKSG